MFKETLQLIMKEQDGGAVILPPGFMQGSGGVVLPPLVTLTTSLLHDRTLTADAQADAVVMIGEFIRTMPRAGTQPVTTMADWMNLLNRLNQRIAQG